MGLELRSHKIGLGIEQCESKTEIPHFLKEKNLHGHVLSSESQIYMIQIRK